MQRTAGGFLRGTHGVGGAWRADGVEFCASETEPSTRSLLFFAFATKSSSSFKLATTSRSSIKLENSFLHTSSNFDRKSLCNPSSASGTYFAGVGKQAEKFE